MSYFSSREQSQSLYDPNHSSETILLAKQKWEVIKLQRTWDAELAKFRESQSRRVKTINIKCNDKAKILHEKIFFTMRWAYPKLSLAYQLLVLEYCDHLTGPSPEMNFEKMSFLSAWKDKMIGTDSEKVFLTVTSLYEKLADVILSRNSSIRKTNEHTALTSEKMTVKMEGSVSWKVYHTHSVSENYWTVWYLSKHNKLPELLRFLKSADCPHIDAFDPDHGFAALHYACMRGHFDAARLLLEAGANERIASQCDGRTPLHMAAAYGSKELVLELLACGADENAVDQFGCTALQLARQNRNKKVVKTLENWNYLVPEDQKDGDEEDVELGITPEELVATDEGIISQMSRPLQVITRRLEAARDVAVVITDRINTNSCVSNGSEAEVKPVNTNIDLEASTIHETENVSITSATDPGAALLLELRLCEKHAYMCMEENFPLEAIKSLRRRWRAVRIYMSAISEVVRYMDIHLGAEVMRQRDHCPVISFQYAVEIGMEAAELCLAYGKYEWAELVISECLLLRELRFLTKIDSGNGDKNDVNENISAGRPGGNSIDNMCRNEASGQPDITALKRRVLLRHCEILLFLHDTASVHALEGPSDWLKKRASHEAFLTEYFAEISPSNGEPTMLAASSVSNPTSPFKDVESAYVDDVAVDTEQSEAVTTTQSIAASTAEDKADPIASDDIASRSKIENGDIESESNIENDTGELITHSTYSNIMEPIIESFKHEDKHQSDIRVSDSIFEAAPNPYLTLARYKNSLLDICQSNAKEVMECQATDEAELSLLWESSTLAPALELLAEAQDRKGYVQLARRNIDRASVIYERALGPFAADTVRCMLESVRLGLRCLMGGNWGADFSEDSTATDSKQSVTKKSKKGSKSVLNSTSKLSSVYGNDKKKGVITLKNQITAGRAEYPEPTASSGVSINGHVMSQSFVSNMMMSVRAEDNKTEHEKLHPGSKQNERRDVIALPSVESYGSQQAGYHDSVAGLPDDVALNEMLGESTYPFESTFGPQDVEPETYNESVTNQLTDDERRAETLHVNRAAIDVSRRLDNLSITDPSSADKFGRKCSNLIAMAELLASEARHKIARILKAEKEGRWLMKGKNNLPQALSVILSSKQQRVQQQNEINHSHYSSYISNKVGNLSVERSESAPAVMQLERKSKTVRLADESQFVPEGSTLSLGSGRNAGTMQKSERKIGGIMKKSNPINNAPTKVIPPVTAPAVLKHNGKEKNLPRSNSHVKSTSGKTPNSQKDALLKLPKFSKNSFSSKLDPQYGESNSEWVSSFAEASADFG